VSLEFLAKPFGCPAGLIAISQFTLQLLEVSCAAFCRFLPPEIAKSKQQNTTPEKRSNTKKLITGPEKRLTTKKTKQVLERDLTKPTPCKNGSKSDEQANANDLAERTLTEVKLFRQMAEEEIYRNRVEVEDGRLLTLKEQLTEDKQEYLDKGKMCKIVFGSRLHRKCCDRWSLSTFQDALVPEDDLFLDRNPELLHAVNLSRLDSSKEHLLKWFKNQATKVPQPEFCGIVAHLLELKPLAGGSHYAVCMEGCRYVAKHNYKTTHPTEWKCFKPVLDATLAQTFVQMSAKNMSVEQYWWAWHQWAREVIDRGIIEQWIASGKVDWDKTDSPWMRSVKLGLAMLSLVTSSWRRR